MVSIAKKKEKKRKVKLIFMRLQMLLWNFCFHVLNAVLSENTINFDD